MMYLNGFIIVGRRSFYSFVNLRKDVMFKKKNFIPTRTFINKWKSEKPEQTSDLNREKEQKEMIFNGLDDPNFTTAFLKGLREPNFAEAEENLSIELNKLYNELRTFYASSYRIDKVKGRIDMLFTFEKEEDLKNFQVFTDSSFLQGYSSASLKLSQEGTGIFSGNICTDVPKDGNVNRAGYANFANLLQYKSFRRIKFYDFTEYTHLVFKIRGDGRTYMVIINIHGDFEELENRAYVHPLYTRGGPYWQIAKIPLSHFYLTSKGKINFEQNVYRTLREIRTIGITAVGFDGPFKLEVDYVGLEHKAGHKDISPYEGYR